MRQVEGLELRVWEAKHRARERLKWAKTVNFDLPFIYNIRGRNKLLQICI